MQGCYTRVASQAGHILIDLSVKKLNLDSIKLTDDEVKILGYNSIITLLPFLNRCR